MGQGATRRGLCCTFGCYLPRSLIHARSSPTHNPLPTHTHTQGQSKKLDTMYASLQKVEPWVDAIPRLVERYAAAGELIEEAASFGLEVQALQREAAGSAQVLALLQQGMRDLQDTMARNEEVLAVMSAGEGV